MRYLILVLLLLSMVLSVPAPVLAGHKKNSVNPTFSASVAKNKRSVSVSFKNLSSVKSIKYQLTYNSTRGPQGVSGTVKPKTPTLNRSLLLGTCSKKVCVYHQKVKNIILTVDFNLKNEGVVSYSKKL